MAIKQQVMALNPARKGNMGRLNSSQPLYVYDTLIAQPWLKGVIAQIRGEKAIPGVDAGDEKAVKKAREGLKDRPGTFLEALKKAKEGTRISVWLARQNEEKAMETT